MFFNIRDINIKQKIQTFVLQGDVFALRKQVRHCKRLLLWAVMTSLTDPVEGDLKRTLIKDTVDFVMCM